MPFLHRPVVIVTGAVALVSLLSLGTAAAMADGVSSGGTTPALTTTTSTPLPAVTNWLPSEPPPPKKPVGSRLAR
jgi:hypothetical protein